MDVAAYQIDRKDFILSSVGQYYSDRTTPLTEQFQNIGGVRNRGVELGVKTDAKNTWSGDIAYTYLNAIFTRNDTYWMTMGTGAVGSNGLGASQLYNNTNHTVPRSPRHKVNLSGRYRATEAWSFTAEVNAQTGIYADEVNIVWIGGRTVANLATNYEIKSAGGYKLSLFGRIDNLFDRFYYTTIRGGSDSDGSGVYNANDPSITVNAGRVWTAGLTLNF
jgi:iron complex outermembrane receptor protein